MLGQHCSYDHDGLASSMLQSALKQRCNIVLRCLGKLMIIQIIMLKDYVAGFPPEK